MSGDRDGEGGRGKRKKEEANARHDERASSAVRYTTYIQGMDFRRNPLPEQGRAGHFKLHTYNNRVWIYIT